MLEPRQDTPQPLISALNPLLLAHYRQSRSVLVRLNQHKTLLYRQTLKEQFVLFALKKLLRKVKDNQQKMVEQAKGTKYLVGEEDENMFVRGKMKKRVVQNKIEKGMYYVSIEPIPKEVRNIRKAIFQLGQIVEAFSTKGCLLQYKNMVKTTENTPSRRTRRQAISIISAIDQNLLRARTVSSNSSSLNNIESKRRKRTDFHEAKRNPEEPKNKLKLQRSITDLYMFKEINKELNNFTHQKAQYEKLAMKHIIKAVYEKSTLAKADLMMIQRWVSQLQAHWLHAIGKILVQVNWFTSMLIRKLIASGLAGHVEQDASYKIRKTSEYVTNIPKLSEEHSAQKLESFIEIFKKLYNELTFVSNRYLCTGFEEEKINTEKFKELLTVSSKVRYLLGFLHKQIQQLLQVVEDGSYSQNIGTVTANSLYEQKAENIRITNLSRALKKKYNMNYTSNEVWDDTQKSRSLYVRHNNDHKRFLKQDKVQ